MVKSKPGRALSDQDKAVLQLADRYVRDVLVARARPAEPVDWRGYHEAAKRQLMTYPRRVS